MKFPTRGIVVIVFGRVAPVTLNVKAEDVHLGYVPLFLVEEPNVYRRLTLFWKDVRNILFPEILDTPECTRHIKH